MLLRSFPLLLVAILLVDVLDPSRLFVHGAFCRRSINHTQPPNLNPIYTDAPIFLRAVPNGELYQVGNAENRIHLLHLYGYNGYDFGYAAGQLLGDLVPKMFHGAWSYFREQIVAQLNGSSVEKKYRFSAKMLELIANAGLEAALDVQNLECAPFTDPEIYAEMRGLADATGMDYHEIVRVHLFGELTQAQCSYYGAYKSATLGGKTLQLRALDWDLGPSLQNYPTVTIYHPLTPSMGVPFANVGWAGWIGVLTGMSSNKLGVTAIGISQPDDTFGDESFIGIPFIFLERQIVQYGKSVWDAMEMIQNATRTCLLVIGVADGNAGTARMVQYSHSEISILNATAHRPPEWWHPVLNDTVYCGMDWICPYFQYALYKQLSKVHGILTPENSITNVTAVVGTGDLHTAVYDLTDGILFVANARSVNQTGPEQAYARQFIRLNLTSHFQKPYGQGR